MQKVLAGKADLRAVLLCLCGAAPLLADTKQRFEALTAGRIVEGYALTESMMATVLTPVNGTYKEGSIGLPLPDVELRIVDTEGGARELPLGTVGEVLMRAPQVMAGYWRNADETALVVRGGWLYTGDLGYLDEDGYLFLVYRKKDVIKPSGFQVWPREVEEVLAAHPAVAEVGVAWIPRRVLWGGGQGVGGAAGGGGKLPWKSCVPTGVRSWRPTKCQSRSSFVRRCPSQ